MEYLIIKKMELGSLYDYRYCAQVVGLVNSDRLKVIQSHISRARELEGNGKEFDYDPEIGDTPYRVLFIYRDCLYIPVFNIETPLQ